MHLKLYKNGKKEYKIKKKKKKRQEKLLEEYSFEKKITSINNKTQTENIKENEIEKSKSEEKPEITEIKQQNQEQSAQTNTEYNDIIEDTKYLFKNENIQIKVNERKKKKNKINKLTKKIKKAKSKVTNEIDKLINKFISSKPKKINKSGIVKEPTHTAIKKEIEQEQIIEQNNTPKEIQNEAKIENNMSLNTQTQTNDIINDCINTFMQNFTEYFAQEEIINKMQPIVQNKVNDVINNINIANIYKNIYKASEEIEKMKKDSMEINI